MKEFKINPYNVYGGRRYKYLPPHIETININNNSSTFFTNRVKILEWIENNLKGRYFFGHITKLIDNRMVVCESVGFEDPYEVTLFLLGCPYMAKSATPII